jgi:glycopeptide antibiotics resistance protein
MKNKEFGMIQIRGEILFIPLLLVFALVIGKHIKNIKSEKAMKALIMNLSFVIYILGAINILYFPVIINYGEPITRSASFVIIPILPILESFSNISDNQLFVNIIYLTANFLLFFPLSLYLTLRRPSEFRKNLIVVISISASAEILQLFIILITRYYNRIIDINDLMLNAIGAALSLYILNKFLNRHKDKNADNNIKISDKN